MIYVAELADWVSDLYGTFVVWNGIGMTQLFYLHGFPNKQVFI